MRFLILLIAIIPSFFWAQTAPVLQDSTEVKYLIIEGDSIPTKAIYLDEVLVLPKLRFNSKKERIKYLILRRKTLKVYRYAKLAAERLLDLEKRLKLIKRRGEKKSYTKIIHKYLEKEFAAELKKLTKTEGQILVKLIHRQTGRTTFDLIKELRSGWRAFWYNNTASLFDISLKKEFSPLKVEDDFLIEDILQRAFQNERLEKQQPAFEIDYYACSEKWYNSESK